MHELAHVYNEQPTSVSRFLRFFGKTPDVRELEVQADLTASRWLIDYLLNPKPEEPQRQMFYAGAEFAFRVRMAMETVGMRFERTHPAAGDRVAALRERLRETAGPQTFYAIANTSLAFDQMWRAIEQLLRNRTPNFDLTLDDVLASMATLVAELLKGSDINDIISVRKVESEPGKMQVMLAPKEPQKQPRVASARDYMKHVSPNVREVARERATDVFERGTAEYSILLAFLGS